MESVETFLEKFPFLTTEEKLEIVNQQWLLANAPESSRARAMTRINSLLESGGVDARAVMKTMRDITKDLQKAIEDRIAKMRLVSS